MKIGLIEPHEHNAVFELLAMVRLPLDGLGEHFPTTLVARQDQEVVGSAALELYGTAALLRSVAVAPSAQSQGFGQQLTNAIFDLAQHHGVHTLYLLTETAADFFIRQGFELISRAEVEPAVQQSVEFVSACPASAQVLRLSLPQSVSSRYAQPS